MPIFLRQSTAVDVAIGPFLDATDAVTAETALTISQADVRLKKNNGAWAQVSDATSATHEENGWYEKELDATDTDTCGRLLIAVHESGALPIWHEFWVLEEAIYDALFAASANAFTGAAGSTTLTALATGSITAAVIATDAIDADAIADNAINAGAIASDAITSAKIADGAIDANTFAAGAINAAAIANGAIDSATFANDTGLASIRSNTAQAGAATTITLDASASAVNDFYNDDLVYIVSGTGVGQARFITNYDGSTKVATVATWATNPDNTSVFTILPSGSAAGALTAAGIADAVWDEALPGAYGSGTAGKIIGDNINATISSRATQTSVDTVDDLLDTEVAAIFNRIGAPVGASISADIAAVKTQTAAIETDTAEIGAAGAGLTAINLPDQTMNITGNITGNLSGSVGSVTGAVGSVTGAVGSVTGNVGGNVAGSVASVTATVSADIVEINGTAVTGDGNVTPWGPA
jgi:hypothetical protein